MRIFASERVSGLMQKLGMEEGEAIEHPWVSKAIENAQRKVEGRNFDMRKQLLEYDDVANEQRKVIYEQRDEIMESEDISETIHNIREDVVKELVDIYIPPQSLDEQWDISGLEAAIEKDFGQKLEIQQWLDEDDDLHEEPLRQRILESFEQVYAEKEMLVGKENMRHFEKVVMLQVVDNLWKEHLAAMDYLRQGIHLRGYAQKNPKQEYKRESFELFMRLLERIKHEVISIISHVQISMEDDVRRVEEQRQQAPEMQYQHENAESLLVGDSGNAEELPEPAEPFVRDGRKVGRNEPCPCGSGKKYKQCHGKLK
jgi:preprotein translocase subunit SecA